MGRVWPRHEASWRAAQQVVSLHVTPGYLRTDQWTYAVSSVESSIEFATRAECEPSWWRWLIVGLHSTVQGFMVLALEQGNGFAVMRPDIAAAWLKAYENGTPFPDDKMDFFLALYAKVKAAGGPGYFGDKAFVPGPTHDWSMSKLNEFRNEFIHFMPKGWSLELAGLPKLARECVEVAEFLAWESGKVMWHDEALMERAKSAFPALQAKLANIERQYQA